MLVDRTMPGHRWVELQRVKMLGDRWVKEVVYCKILRSIAQRGLLVRLGWQTCF